MQPKRTLWFFQRTAPGQIRRIPKPSMQRFLVGERPLPDDGDGFVRCIGVSVDLRGRRPWHIGRLWFSKIPVLGNGHIDPNHRPETVRIARQGQESDQEEGGSVVRATHRFALRRLSNLIEWLPEQSDVDALRLAVNQQAGREMM